MIAIADERITLSWACIVLDRKTELTPQGITYLPWDSQHFGLRVGCLDLSRSDVAAVPQFLHAAKESRFQLIYLCIPCGAELPGSVLAGFGATLVDRKTRFTGPVGVVPGSESACVPVKPYPVGPACHQLLRLGVAAGSFSRFFVDRRIPRDLAIALYETWIDRSARRELADAVFVASLPSAPDELAGMVTVAINGGAGRIGLLAVSENARGRGVGKALVQAAHGWMIGHGVARAEVVTQAANDAACRLYASCGYRISEQVDVYHCWLSERG